MDFLNELSQDTVFILIAIAIVAVVLFTRGGNDPNSTMYVGRDYNYNYQYHYEDNSRRTCVGLCSDWGN